MKPAHLTIAALAAVLLLIVVLIQSLGGADPASGGAPLRSAPTSGVPLADASGSGPLPSDLAGDARGGEGARVAVEGAASEEAETAVLRGRVLQPAGHPADPDLTVFALRGPCRYLDFAAAQDAPDDPMELPDSARRRAQVRGGLIGRAPVASDGTFELELPPGRRVVHLMVRGRYLYLPSTEPAPVGAPALLAPEAGAWVRGTVVGPDGSPAAGADVRLFDLASNGTRGYGERPGSFACLFRVGESGRYEALAVPCRIPYQWSARAEALGALRGDLGLLQPLTEVVHDITLDGGGRVQGLVVDASGRPVPGAEVSAWLRGKFFGLDDELIQRVTVDADGRYDLIGLPVGGVRINADHPSYLASRMESVETREGEPVKGIDHVLEPGNSIAGRVVDEAGAPVPGVQVLCSFEAARVSGPNLMNAMRGDRSVAETDATGRFELRGLGSGPFVVEAEHRLGWDECSARASNVLPGGEEVELVLRRALHLAGTVVDEQGAPVPSFSVIARQEVMGEFAAVTVAYQREAFADPAGAFFLGDLIAGSWLVTVEGEGLVSSAPVPVELPSSEAEALALSVVRAATVSGRVVDPEGNPVPGATVGIDEGSVGWQVASDPYPDTPEATADEEGVFLLDGLVPGELGLVASADGFSRGRTVSLALEPGEERSDLTLVLTDGGTITGEVYDAEGGAASGFLVMGFQMVDFTQVIGACDGRGEFTIPHVPEGKYMVIAMDPAQEMEVGEDGMDVASMVGSFKMAQADVVEGEETHVVIGAAPEELVVVTGRVTLDGEPYAGALVGFIPPGGSMYQDMRNATVDEDGRYQAELDGSGPYVVSIQVVSGVAGQQNSIEYAVDIPAGTTEATYDFELPLGRISGRLIGPDGEPAGGARVTLTHDGVVRSDSFFGGQYTEITTRADGAFDIRALRPGTYRLSAGGASPFSGAAQVPYGRTTTGDLVLGEDEWMEGVTLRLPRPGQLDVLVLDAAGRPVPGASVFVRDAGGRMLEPFSMVVTDGAGRCAYGGVAPGEVTVSARGGLLTCEESEPVEVPEGGSTSVTLRLDGGTILWVVLRDAAGKPTTAAVSVKDEAGREMTGTLGMSDLQALYMDGQFSPNEHRLGPLAPGRYEVTAVISGKVVSKKVRLRGEAEKRLGLRAR